MSYVTLRLSDAQCSSPEACMRSCDAGKGVACYMLRVSFEDTFPPGAVRAQLGLINACARGDGEACFIIGTEAADRETKVDYFEKACKRDVSQGCACAEVFDDGMMVFGPCAGVHVEAQ
ncbi:hypothetical protein [Sorangium sp. So ce861]|uniref:hypothetical protein n=1 Tax=Sorangium sp. So ce861 TaxID=3133323 RepID=UPI003F5F4B25